MITSVRDSSNSVPSKDKPLPVQYYYMHVGNVTAENSERNLQELMTGSRIVTTYYAR